MNGNDFATSSAPRLKIGVKSGKSFPTAGRRTTVIFWFPVEETLERAWAMASTKLEFRELPPSCFSCMQEMLTGVLECEPGYVLWFLKQFWLDPCFSMFQSNWWDRDDQGWTSFPHVPRLGPERDTPWRTVYQATFSIIDLHVASKRCLTWAIWCSLPFVLLW